MKQPLDKCDCIYAELEQEKRHKNRKKKKLWTTVKEQVESNDYTLPNTDYDMLLKKGQPDTKPYILHPEDNAVIVIKNDLEDHWNVGTTGTRITIEKGECGRCGCNRIRVGYNAQAGVIANCVACNITSEKTDQLDW